MGNTKLIWFFSYCLQFWFNFLVSVVMHSMMSVTSYYYCMREASMTMTIAEKWEVHHQGLWRFLITQNDFVQFVLQMISPSNCTPSYLIPWYRYHLRTHHKSCEKRNHFWESLWLSILEYIDTICRKKLSFKKSIYLILTVPVRINTLRK